MDIDNVSTTSTGEHNNYIDLSDVYNILLRGNKSDLTISISEKTMMDFELMITRLINNYFYLQNKEKNNDTK